MPLPAAVSAQIIAMANRINREGFVPLGDEHESLVQAARAVPDDASLVAYTNVLVKLFNEGRVPAGNENGCLTFLNDLAGSSAALREIIVRDVDRDSVSYYMRTDASAEAARGLMSKTLAPITGLRVTPMGGSAPAAPDDAVEATRPPETGRSPASDAAEAKLQDAINLIGATTDQTIRLRAIRQVREVVVEWREEWRDFADEREMFADLIIVGLDYLANWVGDADAIEQKRATTLQTVKRNIEEAIDWATQNRYVKFAGSLAGVLKFLQNLQ